MGNSSLHSGSGNGTCSVYLFRWTDTGGAEGTTENLGLLYSFYNPDQQSESRTPDPVFAITESGSIIGRRPTYRPGEIYPSGYSFFIWRDDGAGIQDILPGLEGNFLGMTGDRFYGSEQVHDENGALVGVRTFIWTEGEGEVRYMDDLFADQLLTADQLQDGTISGWLTVYAVSGGSDEQMQGYGIWWDGKTQTMSVRFISLSTASAIPEPATWALLAGLALLARAVLRRPCGNRA
ncbi:MAG: hypothetical protein LBK99_12375 [Opitutaceae bacterium]|jgi:hypothetical protein|nr:hypothetical protein [Opitutaceae bacterium]